MTTKSTNNATARLSNADETAVTYVYAAGVRHDASCFAVVEALLDAGLVGDLDVYRPTGDPRGDVAALCASNVVVHVGAERTASDVTVDITAYGLGVPVFDLADILDAA
jgi:hypothetical protein